MNFLRQMVSRLNDIYNRIGRLETQKIDLIGELQNTRQNMRKFEMVLKEEYGSDEIDLSNGNVIRDNRSHLEVHAHQNIASHKKK